MNNTQITLVHKKLNEIFYEGQPVVGVSYDTLGKCYGGGVIFKFPVILLPQDAANQEAIITLRLFEPGNFQFRFAVMQQALKGSNQKPTNDDDYDGILNFGGVEKTKKSFTTFRDDLLSEEGRELLIAQLKRLAREVFTPLLLQYEYLITAKAIHFMTFEPQPKKTI